MFIKYFYFYSPSGLGDSSNCKQNVSDGMVLTLVFSSDEEAIPSKTNGTMSTTGTSRSTKIWLDDSAKTT